MTTKEYGGLVVSSAAFNNGEIIPSKYTCEGEEINPPLRIENMPDAARTLAIIAEDPDAPRGTFDHWIVWNIPVTKIIEENSIPGISGINGSGKTGYHPPCPPSGSHRYYFYVFALDTSLDLKAGENKQALQKAMDAHILAKGQLMGRYQKTKQKSS
jgi:Raf kinase inhibitor-like YbhB/YbcL family protein